MSASEGRICPYLGITWDPSTHMGYSSDENVCFKERKPHSPSYSKQIRSCLTPTYINCTTFQGFEPQPFSLAIQEKQPVILPQKTIRKPVALFVFGLLVILGTFSGILFFTGRIPTSRQPVDGLADDIKLPTTLLNAAQPIAITIYDAPSRTIISTYSPIVEEGVVLSPVFFETGTPLPDPNRFEVTRIPGGSGQSYLVHIVLYGETMDMIAVKYNTTIEAIMAVNYKLKPPIWARSPLVIPIGAQDPTDLPSFEVYVVEGIDLIPAETLADELGVDVQKLEFYNNCTKDCKFSNGDVILVPHSR